MMTLMTEVMASIRPIVAIASTMMNSEAMKSRPSHYERGWLVGWWMAGTVLVLSRMGGWWIGQRSRKPMVHALLSLLSLL